MNRERNITQKLTVSNDTPKLPKWRNVGYAEFSKSKRSIRIWISRKFRADYCYVGVESLKRLLEGRKKTVSVYVLEEAEKHGSV